jgi:hypothetical protein
MALGRGAISKRHGRKVVMSWRAYVLGVAIVAGGIAGCSGEDRSQDATVVPPMAAGGDGVEAIAPQFAAIEESGKAHRAERGAFAVSHELGIAVAPQWVHPHFLAVRDACLNDKAMRCELLGASANVGRREGGFQSAFVDVRVPHDSVAAFKARAVAALTGETESEIEVRRDRTTTANVGRPIADVARRQKYLTAYRDRLDALAARAESRVEDLIRIAEALSRVQAEIEELERQERDLSESAEGERVRVVFEAQRPAVSAADPVSRVWANGTRIFWKSVADVLAFVLWIGPWLPLVALMAGGVIGAVRMLRRRL